MALPIIPANTGTTPKEELLESEDYNSVFKSRPKIALSPPFTPQPATGIRPTSGVSRARLSPEFMSLNSATSSEDGDAAAYKAGLFGSPSANRLRGAGGSRIPGRRR